MSHREATEIAIDIDLACLTPAEVEGAFRSLCGAMLLRAAQELGVTPQLSKRSIDARKVTRAWLFEDLGLITFRDACRACNVERSWFLDSLIKSAEEAAVRRNAPKEAAERWVFGRRYTQPATV